MNPSFNPQTRCILQNTPPKFLLCFILTISCGCAFFRYYKPVDLAQTEETGWIILTCKNPFGQDEVLSHFIQMDGNDPVEVGPEGKIPFFVDVGQHRIQFTSLGSLRGSRAYPGYEILKDEFYVYGKIKEITVDLNREESFQIEYISPFRPEDDGEITIKKFPTEVLERKLSLESKK